MAEKNDLVAGSCRKDQSSTPSSSTRSNPSAPHRDGLYDSLVHEIRMPPQNPKKAKTSNQSDHPPSLSTLPDEIIAEILSWLPVKSLIRFRCVCKSFKALFSDPQFIKTHLRKITSSSESKPNHYEKIVLTCVRPPYTLVKSCSLYSIYNESQTDAIELDHFSLRDKYHYTWLVGSCDGLLCMAAYNTAEQNYVALWNPSTRVVYRLPGLGFGNKSEGYTCFGFGYDSNICDYKVVAVFCFRNWGDSEHKTRVKVCTLGTKSWRRIEDFGYGVPYDVSGKYVNGSLSWPAMCERDSRLAWIIVSLDLAKETYKEILQPDYGEDDYDSISLGVVNGCLCMMCDIADSADLWVMKDFGVRQSWTKLLSIPYLDDPGVMQYSIPYYIADNGEVLMEGKDVLLIYNPKDGTFRYSVINGARRLVEAELYIETLVSP